MKQEHHPYDVHSLNNGANSDDDPEVLGSQNTGEYVDMRNGTDVDDAGNTTQIVRRLHGEQVVYANNLPAGSYQCMWRGMVLDYDTEVFADEVAVAPSLIRVNGTIVLQSSSFGVTVADPPQVDTDQRISGGEMVITAPSLIPLILNVGDMVTSLVADPNKYFSAFDPKLYEVNQYTNLDTLVYDSHQNLGGGAGLPPGNYQYMHRSVSVNGDKTNLSVPTPMIPILQSMSSASAQFPYSKTYGGDPNPEFGTSYGIKLKFRVTNLYNYDYIEIVRISWNQGAGIGFNPTPEVVARIDIAPNEISIREYVDPGDQNIDPAIKLSDAELNMQSIYLTGAKSPRYYDNRLEFGNLHVASKITELTFSQISGSEVHPVIENLGKAGYSDLYNYVYRRHYTHGERVGLGIQCFDGVFGRGFTQKVTNGTNVQIPNRRDETSATTELYSYGGTVKAANVNGTVSQTHEVFDLTDAESKSDTCSFKNIYRTGGFSATGYKSKSTINEDCNEPDNGAIENHGAKVQTATNFVFPYYHPFTPVSEQDSDVSGHNFIVNTQVSVNASESAPDAVDYRPAGFGPNYYSQGLMLSGVDNFPDWVKGFSVVRGDVAGVVVAQGLGCYAMDPAEFNAVGNTKLCTKAQDAFWFFSPDIENGIVNSDTLNDIIANPQNYAIQFVSPLGFFSEVYNFENNSLAATRNRIIDMISYVRMIRDVDGGQINPSEDPNMGISGGDGYRYVAYDKWRNVNQNPNTFASPSTGNRVVNIESIERVSEGRGNYLKITSDIPVYGASGTGGSFHDNFEDDGMKDWTEPVYVINIIRTGAQPADADITLYKNVHFQKLESIIGRGNGTSTQRYELVDERWEDCIPALSSTHPTASTDRYLYVRDTAGVEGRWINVTFYSAAQRAAIVSSIVNTGSYLGSVGAYTHENVGNRKFTIVFDQPGLYPNIDDLIIVKYDNTAPIRFWGGDAVIGESIFAPIDRESDATDDASSTQFAMGIGFPYGNVKLNPRYYQVNRTTGVNRIQDQAWTRLGYIRQLCMMFTVESRGAMAYAFNRKYPIQYFPLINYVMRPHRWEIDKAPSEQNIYDQYEIDYPGEKDQWKWGGFRFIQTINPEYSNEPQKIYVSQPEFGYNEETHFPYRVAWSLVRAVNVRNAPGIRTFPANNVFDIDDKSGDIKMLISQVTDRGDNLYAIVNSGSCLLLTNKSILSDLNSGEIAYMASPSFIKGQYWISRSIGMPDEWWRSAAESEFPVITSQSGAEEKVDGVIWGDGKTFYLFMNNKHTDIGKSKYYRKVYEAFENVQPGYLTKICAAFHDQHGQYWIHIANTEEFKRTLMYNQRKGKWVGYNDFRFDRMAMNNKVLEGTRAGVTYAVDRGYILNGDPITFNLDVATSPSPFDEKEFIRIRVNSRKTQKPKRVEFYDKDMTLLCFVDQATLGALYMKLYDGWEAFIPRKLANPAGERLRLQDRSMIARIIYDDAGSDFEVVSVGIQSKILK